MNRPLSAGVSLSRFDNMWLTLCSVVISAFGPPISVFTQPGCSATQMMPSSARKKTYPNAVTSEAL